MLFSQIAYLEFRYLFLTEEDIVTLPCFQVIFLLTMEGYSNSLLYQILVILIVFLLLTYLTILLCYYHYYCKQNQTLIAIKAPNASYIEVPDPDQVGCIGRCGFNFFFLPFNVLLSN